MVKHINDLTASEAKQLRLLGNKILRAFPSSPRQKELQEKRKMLREAFGLDEPKKNPKRRASLSPRKRGKVRKRKIRTPRKVTRVTKKTIRKRKIRVRKNPARHHAMLTANGTHYYHHSTGSFVKEKRNATVYKSVSAAASAMYSIASKLPMSVRYVKVIPV